MSSISSGSIHREINDVDVKSICQYAQSMCGGQYMSAKYTFLSGKKLPQKLLMAFLPAQLHAIYSEQSLNISSIFPVFCAGSMMGHIMPFPLRAHFILFINFVVVFVIWYFFSFHHPPLF